MPSSTNKRPSDDGQGPGSARKRIALGPASTTNHSSSSPAGPSRTGQACDRCKVRKIRCDAKPGGCSPCAQNNTECRTTDRITGRAVSRGHTETVESENNNLRAYISDLHQQLRDHGIEPKQPPPPPQPHASSSSLWGEDGQRHGSWADLIAGGGLPTPSTMVERRSSNNSVLPAFRAGSIGDNYLGVSLGDDALSHIAGTQLTLFGAKIDLAEFIPPDSEMYSTSYDTFLHTALGKAPSSPPPLPDYPELTAYAKSYFNLIQVFTPILHRPDFMKIISLMESGSQKPTMPEKVMLHMVVAIVMSQYGLRNTGDQAAANHCKAQAVRHYHFAISHVPDLLRAHQLPHIQALALICLQLRQQPRLGAAWTFTNTVLGLAIELGLHRTANAWQSPATKRDAHDLEMRKRVFWSLLVIHVTVGGKLGRPMPLRIQDFDIELPEHMPDNEHGPTDSSLSDWEKCSFRAAIPGMKLLRILMQVYATVYSIREDPAPYEITVQRLEQELADFRQSLPPEISGGPKTKDTDRCPALYLQMAEQEIRLILHHPSIAPARSDVNNKNMDVCLDASKKLLSAASGLQALIALDTTWYYSTDYLAAIFTTLFTWTQRMDQITSAEYHQLRSDMDKWIHVMGDVGTLLGTGMRLHDRLQVMIEHHLAQIKSRLDARMKSASVESSSPPAIPINSQEYHPTAPPSVQQIPLYQQGNGYDANYSSRAPGSEMVNQPPPGYAMPAQHMEQPQHHQPSYPPQGYYQQPPPVHVQTYPGMGQFDASTPYQAGPDMKAQLETHLTHASIPPQAPPSQVQLPTHITPPQHYMPTYHPPPQNPDAYSAPYSGTAWRNFADNLFADVGGQDYMQSATALMALGDKQHMGSMAGMSMPPTGPQQTPHDGQDMLWPMVQYGPTTHGPQ